MCIFSQTDYLQKKRKLKILCLPSKNFKSFSSTKLDTYLHLLILHFYDWLISFWRWLELITNCLFWTGFSDPYCLLTIMEDEEESRTRQSRAKPLKSVVKDAVSHDKIYQTDIKKQTLNPIWNQTFILWVTILDNFCWSRLKRPHYLLLFLFLSENLDILQVPASTLRCGEKNRNLHFVCFKVN